MIVYSQQKYHYMLCRRTENNRIGARYMDFAAELKKLIDAEDEPLLDMLSELARAQLNTQAGALERLDRLQKSGDDISLQIEEIYDIVKEADANAKEVKSAERRELRLLESLIAILDIIDDVMRFLRTHGVEHVDVVAAKTDEAASAADAEMTRPCFKKLVFFI